MGLLDSILGSVLGSNNSSQSAGMGSILGSLLSSQGGVSGIVQKLNQAGLGGAASSWVGQGQNQDVEPHQLGDAIGHDQVNQWSQQTGMSHDSILSQLSKMLPQAVDKMTPNGRIEDDGQFSPGGAGAFGGAGQGAASQGTSPFDEAGLELPKR